MQRYKCHKEVSAFKIGRVDIRMAGSFDLGAVIVPEDTSLPGVQVKAQWVDIHHPYAGGYYVQYEDGYSSFSPAEAFENGYTMISGDGERTYTPPPITGYRTLTQAEVDLMNAIKQIGNHLGELIAGMEVKDVDKRWLAIAKTDLQKGIMFLVRSVAKPESF